MIDFLTRGYWRITKDADFVSSTKRRATGREDILDDGVVRDCFLPEYQDLESEPEAPYFVASYLPDEPYDEDD